MRTTVPMGFSRVACTVPKRGTKRGDNDGELGKVGAEFDFCTVGVVGNVDELVGDSNENVNDVSVLIPAEFEPSLVFCLAPFCTIVVVVVVVVLILIGDSKHSSEEMSSVVSAAVGCCCCSVIICVG
ncbi:hypothetical protein GQX74_014849 [Glossina fuscipes]|nr:hypothetical protein GQX74_014849 [Glossina fuscipes]